MFTCPNCKSILIRKQGTTGVYWSCDRCGGRAVGIGLLRKTIGEKIVAEAWSRALGAPASSGRPCPICCRDMAKVTLTVEDKPLVLDLCQRCEFMWFDPKEYESIPLPPPKPRALGDVEERTLPQAAREALAFQKVQEIARQAKAEDPELDNSWKAIPAIFGLPVEIESSPMNSTPWATYLLSALIVAVSVWAFCDLKPAVDKYGLIPAQAWRYDGLTFLTSFFLHGGVFHLVGNLYFFLLFGRPVEDFLGWRRCLLLVFLSALAGDFLHIIADPHTTMPCIGASGGISGIIAFYALKFPHARLGILLRYYIYFRWIQFPAWMALLLWLLLQVWGAFQQVTGFSNVSSLAHLGGLAVGFVFWLAWRNIDLKPAPGLLPVKVV
jgi:membrane associated rhomboid family serine protease/Zn-finger nucleic acid-binding protein